MIDLIIAMTIWGTLGAFVLWSGVSAIEVAFYRCLIGALLIGCMLLRTKQKIKFNKETSQVALAGIFLVLNWVFLFKSFQISNITIGNMSYYLQPLMLVILGIFFYKEKVSIANWLLMALALTGVLLTIDIYNLQSPHILMGVFYALIAALLYSFLTMMMKYNNTSYFQVIFIQLFIGIIILSPFIHFQWLSPRALSCLLIIGVVHTLLAYFVYYRAIKNTTFVQIAVASYLDPIVAIATDIAFFDRHLNYLQLIGIGLTFLSLYYLVISRNKNNVAIDAALM